MLITTASLLRSLDSQPFFGMSRNASRCVTSQKTAAKETKLPLNEAQKLKGDAGSGEDRIEEYVSNLRYFGHLIFHFLNLLEDGWIFLYCVIQ